MKPPETRYTKSGDVSIAYQVVGDGPLDVVFVGGFATHVEIAWELPPLARFYRRLASFSRLILFDKRGTGLSDPVTDVPNLETRMDDVRAVMDAAGSSCATLFGQSEGAPMCVLFAATYPDRTERLVLTGAMARSTEAEDYAQSWTACASTAWRFGRACTPARSKRWARTSAGSRCTSGRGSGRPPDRGKCLCRAP